MRNIAMSTRIKEDGKCCDCVGKVHALSRGDLLYMRIAGGTKRLEDRGKRNTQKSSICKVKEGSVLGFQIHRKKLRSIDPKIGKFKSELRKISRRCSGIAMEGRFQRLAEYARGWMGHYGCGMLYNTIVEMEGWLRRRVRMAYIKQWRKPRLDTST